MPPLMPTTFSVPNEPQILKSSSEGVDGAGPPPLNSNITLINCLIMKFLCKSYGLKCTLCIMLSLFVNIYYYYNYVT